MEAVLILAIVTMVGLKISSMAKSEGYMRHVVEGPWGSIRGMIEDGVWVNYTDAKSLHPNHRARHQSTKGDES